MTVEQIAAYTRVSKRTVYRWIEKGQLQPAEPPSKWLARQKGLKFRKADVDALQRPDKAPQPAPPA